MIDQNHIDLKEKRLNKLQNQIDQKGSPNGRNE